MLRISRKRAFVAALAGAVVLAAGLVAVPSAFAEDTGTIAGHLTDGGNPVPNASVSVYDTTFGWHGNTVTDATGAFELANLSAGTYKLQFSVGAYSQWSVQKPSFDVADLVTVSAGQTTTVEESIRPYGLISGHLTNPDGTPAVNAQVNAYDVNWSTAASATTDATGFYTLRYLAAGSYRVSFQNGWNSPTQYAHNATVLTEADLFAVSVGATTTLDQTFLPFATLTGTITDGGAPAAFVQVDFREVTTGQHYSTSTDPAGQYRVSAWPGTYIVSVRRGQLVQWVPGQVTEAQAQQYTFPAGESVLDEALLPTGTITGAVTLADGSPVRFAGVTATGPAGVAFASTDFQGRYTLRAYPGEYRLGFRTSYGLQWENGRSSADDADPVAVVAGTTITVDEVLAPFGSVTISAVNRTSGAPVNEFCITADFGFHCTTTGTLSDLDALPGRYTVWVQPNDNLHFGGQGEVEVVSGGSASLVVPLDRGATVTTTMTDRQTGAPVANACLQLVNVTEPWRLGMGSGQCSDGTGTVSPILIEPGTYYAFVWAYDGVHGHQWVGPGGGVGRASKASAYTFTAGQTAALPPVLLDGAGTLAGTVTDERTGEPVAGGIAALASWSYGYGGQESMFPIDSQGRFSVGNLGPYQWTLHFSSSGFAEEWMGDEAERDRAAHVKVKAGRTTTYETQLGPGTTVTGQLSTHDGSPVNVDRLEFVNAETGENTGANVAIGAVYSVQLKGEQRVKIRVGSGWVGGTSLADATVFTIPDAPEFVLDLTLPAASM